MNRKFLDALEGKNKGRPPIWLMRQAGRYLPSYQALRAKHSLSELFFTPELAAKVTLLPVQELGVDAAILFSDITVVARLFNLNLDFAEGPIIAPLLDHADQVLRLPRLSAATALAPIGEAIRLCRRQLSVPLIGFCGGPFTVASYLIERKSGGDLPLTKRWLYRDSIGFHALLDRITEATESYLDLQIEAGAQAIQIFDSWAHVLSWPHLHDYCLPYHQRLIHHVQKRGVPVLSFMRGSTQHAHDLGQLRPNAISFDWQRPLRTMRIILGPEIALQGNLDPDLLFAPLPHIEAEAQKLLRSMEGDPAFIVNLGHGVKPETPWQAVRHLVETVASYDLSH